MRSLRFALLLIVAVFAYAYAIRVTQPDLGLLLTSLPKGADIVQNLLTPDVFARGTTSFTLSLAVPIPCGSAPNGVLQSSEARITMTPPCAAEREPLLLRGEGFPADIEVAIRIGLVDGLRVPLTVIKTEPDGTFVFETSARPIAATVGGRPASFEAIASVPTGPWQVTPTLREVFNRLMETLFIALIATFVASLIAAPISFFAARNLMQGRVGRVLYGLTRGSLNITRAFEPLVLATIFALIVGFGKPFAGVLGLIIGTVAALGKLFSEAVEDIDMGTVEAVSATGASRAQVIATAVLPQVLPNWLAYMLYFWDINVRISTIIGFVGAGGIGEYIQRSIDTLSYRQAGTALLAVVLLVWTLDVISAQVRKRLI